MVREKTVDPDKVAIYIRWSTDDQADGTTLEVQLEGCKHYVLSQGWIVNEDLIFIDDGWSGGNLERPALTRLRKLIKAGKIDCVVVFKLDRLSRSVIDMVNLVLEEWEGLTYVKSAREAVDTSSAMGKQFFYMLVSFAEWERNTIKERTMAGRRARAKEGYKPSARAPYGYRHGEQTGSYEIVPSEAAVVDRIFRMYNEGLGAKAIVVRLNSEGVRNRSGKMWNERTILYMLSNPVYTGKMVYGRLTRNPRYGKAEGEPYWLKNEQVTVVEESPYIPPIISEDAFAQAQQLKASRHWGQEGAVGSPRSTSSPYLLTGLAKCKCGYSLYARTDRRNGKEYHYYACLGKKIKGTVFCDAPNIPMTVLDKQVEREILRRYGDMLAREKYKESITRALDQEAKEISAALVEVDQRIAKLEAQERQVRLDYREQVITPSEFRALRKDLLADLHSIRTQRQQLLASKTENEQQQQALSARLQAINHMDRWGELESHEQKNLLRCFVSSITVQVSPENKEVHVAMAWH